MHIQIHHTVLASDTYDNEYTFNFSLREDRQFQIASFINSLQVHAHDHGNTQSTFRFSVTRYHGSTEAAKDFLLSHNSSLQGIQGHAQITESGSTHYLHNAILTHIEGHLNDVSTTHTYILIGGLFSKDLPV